jgi:uncharacterized membrane protein (DUF373 family)
MTWFYFDPLAISTLTFIILSLVITVYLLRIKNKAQSTWWLLGFSAAMTGTILTMFLMYLSPLNFWNWSFYLFGYLGSHIHLVCLIQFAYHFPALPTSQRLEARIVLIISVAVAVLAAGLALYYQFPNSALYESTEIMMGLLGMLIAVEFTWVVVVLLRRTVQPSDAPAPQSWLQAIWRPQGRNSQATRAFALIASIPFGFQVIGAVFANCVVSQHRGLKSLITSWTV